MIDTKVVKDISGIVDLCKTFTDDETKVLKQVETGIVYGSSVVDLIKDYNGGKPFSRFTYVETDKI